MLELDKLIDKCLEAGASKGACAEAQEACKQMESRGFIHPYCEKVKEKQEAEQRKDCKDPTGKCETKIAEPPRPRVVD